MAQVLRGFIWALFAVFLLVIYCLCKASSEAERQLFGEEYFYPEEQDRAVEEWRRKRGRR